MPTSQREGPFWRAGSRPGSRIVALLIISWGVLTLANAGASGTYRVDAILLITISVLLVLDVAWVLRSSLGIVSGAVLWRAAVVLAIGLAALVAASSTPTLYDAPNKVLYTAWAALGVILVLLVCAAAGRPWTRWLVGAGCAAYLTAASLIINDGKRVFIDVYVFSTQAVQGLAQPENPYTRCWVGDGDPHTRCVFPYMPGSALLEGALYWVFHDIRLTLALAMCAAAVAIWRLGGPVAGPALGLLLLAQPRSLLMVEMSWTEPMIIALVALFVLAVTRGRTGWAVVLLAAALFTKQHALLLLPLACFWRAYGVRRTVLSVALVAVATLPWFLVAPGAFLHDAFWFNIRLGPRSDSLSLFSTALHTGWQPQFVLVGGVTFAAMGLALWRLPRDEIGFTVGTATVVAVFTLTNKQSFFNEWSFVAALMIIACATLTANWSGEEPPAVDRVAGGGADRQDGSIGGKVEPRLAPEAER
jgi:hypothetical protein